MFDGQGSGGSVTSKVRVRVTLSVSRNSGEKIYFLKCSYVSGRIISRSITLDTGAFMPVPLG